VSRSPRWLIVPAASANLGLSEGTIRVGTLMAGSLADGTEPGAGWVKSSLSYANHNCVEVADLPGGTVGVRNSRDTDGPVLRFTPDEWRAFIGGVCQGEFDDFGRTRM
jgi:hypothetical protein